MKPDEDGGAGNTPRPLQPAVDRHVLTGVRPAGVETRNAKNPHVSVHRSSQIGSVSGGVGERAFFVAQKQADGTYGVSLTEEGVQTFETALGIADDLGGNSRISPYSTIADIMDRTATREELSRVLRRGGEGALYRARVLTLRRKLRGSENPSSGQRIVAHIGKLIIVAIVALWALKQFAIAIQDIEDIPGILANIPSDILHLHPTSAFGEVGNKIADAGDHVLFGVLGGCFAYLLAKIIQPFARIYRKDQLLAGERLLLRVANASLRRWDERSRPLPQSDTST